MVKGFNERWKDRSLELFFVSQGSFIERVKHEGSEEGRHRSAEELQGSRNGSVALHPDV
jgi:hypothetical protein